MAFEIKRIYEAPSPADGVRILVDRLWPRGVRKADAHLTEWMKDVAPSPDLRLWFGHDPERFAEFRQRYEQELRVNPLLDGLLELGQKKRVTLLYAAHDPQVNHALVLRNFLRRRASPAAKKVNPAQ